MYSIDFGVVNNTPLVLSRHTHIFSDAGQDVLAVAHLHKRTGHCTCTPKRPQMMVRHYRTHYGVARFPNTALLHNTDCPYYAIPMHASGVGSYRGAVMQTAVHVHIPIAVKAPYNRPPKATITTKNHQQRQIRPRLQLRGLLHHIWEQTGLNMWSPHFKGKRSIVARVLEYGYRWGHSDTLISERMLVLFPRMPIKYADHNTGVIQDPTKRILVMGYLNRIDHKAGSKRVVVRFKASTSTANSLNFIDDYLFFGGVWIQQRFESICTHTAHTDTCTNIVVLACAEYHRPTDDNTKHILNILDICFMAVCGYSYGIAFDSTGELTLAQQLIEDDRYFTKPLCYDDTVLRLPNFILNDTQPNTPLCIGLSEQDKTAVPSVFLTDGTYAPWWHWQDVQGTMPPLPVADTYTSKGGV